MVETKNASKPRDSSRDGSSPPERTLGAADEITFKKELVAAIPHLRAFARSLCNDPTQADDLAQEALAKAWKARDSFEPGTSIKAWTFMILHNQFYSEKRRSWRTAPLETEGRNRHGIFALFQQRGRQHCCRRDRTLPAPSMKTHFVHRRSSFRRYSSAPSLVVRTAIA